MKCCVCGLDGNFSRSTIRVCDKCIASQNTRNKKKNIDSLFDYEGNKLIIKQPKKKHYSTAIARQLWSDYYQEYNRNYIGHIQCLNRHRIDCNNKEAIDAFYKELDETIDKYNIHRDKLNKQMAQEYQKRWGD